MILELQKQFFKLKSQRHLFDKMMALEGRLYRDLPMRKTKRFVHDGQFYFIKQHFGVGWREIFKNLLQGRLPIIGAKNEYQAIQFFEQLAIPTTPLMGYGERHFNPAKRESFVITAELKNIKSLEDLCRDWPKNPPDFRFKQKLIRRVAQIARQLHCHGLNHRDFYLCHFLLNTQDCETLYLIDLHRVQIRHRTPLRWRLKDIAGLYFSSMDIGLTQRDLLRFLAVYFNQPWPIVLKCQKGFLKCAEKQAICLYQKIHGKKK